MSTADWIQIGIQLLTLIATGLTVWVALLIYRRQKQDADKRQEEARLLELDAHFIQFFWLADSVTNEDLFRIHNPRNWPPNIAAIDNHMHKIDLELVGISQYKWRGEALNLLPQIGHQIGRINCAKNEAIRALEMIPLDEDQFDEDQYVNEVARFFVAMNIIKDITHSLYTLMPKRT